MKTVTFLTICCAATLSSGLSQGEPAAPKPEDLYVSGHMSRESELISGLYAPIDQIAKNSKSSRVCRMQCSSGWGTPMFAVLCWLDRGKASSTVVLYSLTIETSAHNRSASVVKIADRILTADEVKAVESEFAKEKMKDIGEPKFIPGGGGQELGEEAASVIFESWHRGDYRRGMYIGGSNDGMPKGLQKKRQLLERLIDPNAKQ